MLTNDDFWEQQAQIIDNVGKKKKEQYKISNPDCELIKLRVKIINEHVPVIVGQEYEFYIDNSEIPTKRQILSIVSVDFLSPTIVELSILIDANKENLSNETIIKMFRKNIEEED